MEDEISSKVLNDLNNSYETKNPINEKLIDDYILILTKEIILNNDNLIKFITIINQILQSLEYSVIDPSGILIKLLNKILSFLDFNQILEYYPKEFILEHLYSNSSIITILCLNIINLNLHQNETKQFIETNNILKNIIELFFNKSTTIPILNSIEKLISNLNQNEIYLLNGSMDLFKSIKQSNDSILLSRYLDLFIILSSNLQNVDPTLYQFNSKEILKFNNDPLFLILLIQFYITLIKTKLDINDSLIDILKLYKDDKFEEIVNLEVINLISKMSYHNYKQILEKFEYFKTYNLIKIFDKDEIEIKLLSQSNPNLIYDLNNSIFTDVIVNLPLFDDLYFPILLNFIKSQIVWQDIKPKLNPNKLTKLSKYKLFSLLLVMSNYEWTKEYLFNDLTEILSTEIINSNITNTELWNLKLKILENLNEKEENQLIPGYNNLELKLKQSYDRVRFGENYKNIQPKVEVIDEFD
ncbi:HSM3 [Candida jiufengensis]|uniref:HSM3 n=1 Tax=Candida jiufengensis TaxID=497108 RepID=UPI0022259338|nr:HSM3 [Candida jiufengensis]KAI5949392.1 HSM3 [Candida jiufengensis]